MLGVFNKRPENGNEGKLLEQVDEKVTNLSDVSDQQLAFLQMLPKLFEKALEKHKEEITTHVMNETRLSLEAQEQRIRRDIQTGVKQAMFDNIPKIIYKSTTSVKEYENKKKELCHLKESLLEVQRKARDSALFISKPNRKGITLTDDGYSVYTIISSTLTVLAETLGVKSEKYDNKSKKREFFAKVGVEYVGKTLAYYPKNKRQLATVYSTILRQGLADKYLTHIIDEYIQPEIDEIELQLTKGV